MRQHTDGVVESIIWILLEIYLAFQQWKNFETPLRIDKVIAMSLVYYLLVYTVYVVSSIVDSYSSAIFGNN